MSHSELLQLKETIFRFTEEGLIKYLKISKDQAQDYIKNSTLEESIERAPDVVAHYSQKQLVYEVIR